MITILTGLPKDKNKDYEICREFEKAAGIKIICGTSTMKVYCRELNIKPEIEILTGNDGLPKIKYTIKGIDLALEGAITLNKCYLALNQNKTDNEQINKLADILKNSNSITFLVGTARTADSDLYKEKNILPRKDIVFKISDYLKTLNIPVNIKYI